jgi:hypothetical protein
MCGMPNSLGRLRYFSPVIARIDIGYGCLLSWWIRVRNAMRLLHFKLMNESTSSSRITHRSLWVRSDPPIRFGG